MALSTTYQQNILTVEYQQHFHQLYCDHHGWLYGWLCKKLRCPEQAADLSQDTFVKLMKHSGSLQFHTPRAYLTTIAGRLIYDHYRRQSLEKAYLQIVSQLAEAHAPSPQQQLMVQQALLELDVLFDRMKPAVRKAFLLSQLEGRTYAEIAIELDISLRTVKRYMAKAFEECIMTGLMD